MNYMFQRRGIHAAEAFTILFCALCDALIVYGTGNFDSTGVIPMSMSTDVASVLICSILFAALYIDKNTDLHMEILMLLLVFESVMTMFNSLTWLVDGDIRCASLNIAGRYIKDGLLLATVFMLWYYLNISLKARKSIKRIWAAALSMMLTAGLCMLAANVFTGCLFEVSNGTYCRGPLMTTFFALTTVMLGFGTLYEILSDATRREKFVSIVYMAIAVTFFVIQFYNPGISLVYFAPTIVILIIYVNFYTTRCSELAQKESQIKSERYDVLVSQVKPHLLYNSISSIIAIKGNPDDTKSALFSFSAMLRHNFDMLQCDAPIPFEEELTYTENYIDLEKLRFKNKLTIVMDIQDDRFLIPPQTLQSFVENAILYGVTKKTEGGTVTVTSRLEENKHVIQVIDDGVGFDTSIIPQTTDSIHMGIVFIKRRVESMVGGTLLVESVEGLGTRVTITIPVRKTVNGPKAAVLNATQQPGTSDQTAE